MNSDRSRSLLFRETRPAFQVSLQRAFALCAAALSIAPATRAQAQEAPPKEPAIVVPGLPQNPSDAHDPTEGPNLSVEDPPPPQYVPPSGQGTRGSAVVDFVEPANGDAAAALNTTRPPNKLRVVPSLSLTSTFDDNIFITHHHKDADLYTSLLVGAAFGFGDFRDAFNQLGFFQQGYEELRSPDFDDRNYAFASYTPGGTVFVSHSGEDTFDQVAQAGFKLSLGKFTSVLNADFRQYSEAFVDTGDRERVLKLEVELANKYALTDKTSLEVDFYQFTRLFDNDLRVDSKEYIDQNYLNYQIFPKLIVSGGLRLGLLDVSRGPTQKYEQALVRVKLDTQNRLRFNLFGGVEFRQLGSDGDSTNPIFGFDAAYNLFNSTAISLSAVRQVTNSIEVASENVTSSRVWLSVVQGLFQKTTLTLSLGYENREYEDNGSTIDLGRSDDIYTAGLEFAFHVTKWTAISLGYNYWQNASTVDKFNFIDNRAILRFDLLF